MSNRPQFNVPAFIAAGQSIEARGDRAQLPADLDEPEVVAKLMASPDGKGDVSGYTWGECLAMDVILIADKVDGVAVLHGWMKSKGARLETFVAFLVGKPIVYAASYRKVKKRDLIKAWLGVWYEK
jgi:hypothetical protein